MDARSTRFACANRPALLRRVAVATLLLTAAAAQAVGPVRQASFQRQGAYRTRNFVVTAPTSALAQEIGDSAERWRESLAIEWIGEKMPDWAEPCPIVAKVSPQLGAGGATTFVFDRGRVFGWEMSVQGSRERVLDSVLPHEITHTVFASYFRQPLPRWADEGACTTVEHRSEIGKQERLLIEFLKTGKGIPFSRMFAMKEYPADVLPLYSQGHSLTQFLLERRGKPAFLAFLADGMRDENWRRAVDQHYGHESLYAMQEDWLGWVKEGRPRLDLEPDVAAQLASATTPAPRRPAEPPTNITAAGPSQVARAATAGRPSVYAQAPSRGSVYESARGGSVWR